MGYGMTEPNADTRKAARQLREFYVAYVQAGFSEPQALELVKALLSGAASTPPLSQGE